MFWKIALSQTRHKWGIALLILLAMTSLVTLYVYSSNTAKFANRSMELVMKNMGHNLLILPEQADPWAVYQCTDEEVLFSRTDIALGRHLARVTTQKSLYYLLAIVAAATIMIIAVTGLQGVGDRKQETGIMPDA